MTDLFALCKKLTRAIGAEESLRIAKIFESLINYDEARVMLLAAPPATVEALAQQSGFSEEKIQAMMDSLFYRGLIFKATRGGDKKFYRVKSVPQMHDSTSLTPGISRQVLDLWKEYMEKEWPAYGRVIMDIMPNSIMRVIPVNESVEPQSQVLPYDDAIKLIESANVISVTNCSCRVIDGTCDKPMEVCMQVNRAAEYNIERGTGREISQKEAIDILAQSREAGLVHTVDNRQSVGHVICNCCSDCCLNWPILKGARQWVAPSRFEAFVDTELCTGCESCVERCFFDALSMADGFAAVAPENCLGCGVCTVVCPSEALKLKEVRPADFVPCD